MRIYALLFAAIGFLATFASLAVAADWPTFRGDAARSGYSPDELPGQPTLLWSHRAAQQPAPAWPTRNRLSFDRAQAPIRDYLHTKAMRMAVAEYIKALSYSAVIKGYELSDSAGA